MSAIKYWLWLSSATGASERARAALIDYYGDAEAAYFAPAGEFAKIKNITKRDADILERRDMSAVPMISEHCEKNGISIITYQDALYPARLRNIFAPPAVLYVKGKLPPVDERAAIAVIGTRSATPYGLKMSRRIACEIISCGGMVVSGLTGGIDSSALNAALAMGGECIAVLGTAHEAENSPLACEIGEKGALISEYPPGTKTQRSYFRARNRITSGLSVGVCAVEAPEKSGTALFIMEAAEQGKDIFAVPGNADAENSMGTNGFIKDGAKPVTSGWDILCEFEGKYEVSLQPCLIPHVPITPMDISEKTPAVSGNIHQKAVDKAENTGYIDLTEIMDLLPEDQKKIVSAVNRDAVLTDEIIASTGLSAARVLSQLTVLEIKGIIKRLPGGRISINTLKK